MRNLAVDIIISLLFVVAVVLGFFGFISLLITGAFLFILLVVMLLGSAGAAADEAPSRKYLEHEKKREERAGRNRLIDALIYRIDVMTEKVKYLKLLLRGKVWVLE
jgi:hypothetical protein